MTDYWVSTTKHYCKVCKCWLSGHALNIQNHEKSNRHVNNQKELLKQMHSRERQRESDASYLKSELARIESAALNAAERDASLFTGGRIVKLPQAPSRPTESTLSIGGMTIVSQKPAALPPDAQAAVTFDDEEKLRVRQVVLQTLAKSTDTRLPFIASLKFERSQPGYTFQMGSLGLGYYLDHPPGGSSSSGGKTGDRSKRKRRWDVVAEDLTSETPPSPKELESPKRRGVPVEGESVSQPEEGSSEAASSSSSSAVENPREAPMPGSWEEVKPEDSVFGDCLRSHSPHYRRSRLEPDMLPALMADPILSLKFETEATPILNEDDKREREKAMYTEKSSMKGDATFKRRGVFKKRGVKKEEVKLEEEGVGNRDNLRTVKKDEDLVECKEEKIKKEAEEEEEEEEVKLEIKREEEDKKKRR